MANAESYLLAKFHLYPSNRLATIHQRHRQTDRQTGQTDSGLISHSLVIVNVNDEKKHTIAMCAIDVNIDREFGFYEFISFLKFNEFYEFFLG